MLIGTISKLIADKGIGFITPCGRGRDVFFHVSALVGERFEQLKEGQAVAFDLEPPKDKKDKAERPRAARVELCDPKLLGRTGGAEPLPQRHPRARGRKPTWRE